jgi:mannose-6-phosphate isomerase-like protein (cupin superfamily)
MAIQTERTARNSWSVEDLLRQDMFNDLREGPELCCILAGNGRMSLGDPEGEAGVVWKEVFDVAAGDCFTVNPGQVHQLENSGPDPLNALFGCSATHLTTDRTVLGASR